MTRTFANEQRRIRRKTAPRFPAGFDAGEAEVTAIAIWGEADEVVTNSSGKPARASLVLGVPFLMSGRPEKQQAGTNSAHGSSARSRPTRPSPAHAFEPFFTTKPVGIGTG